MLGNIEQLLRSHQVLPVRNVYEILRDHQSAVDLSDTGVGKTFVAAAVAARMQIPTLVVCPKIVMSAWHRAAAHFGDTVSVINYESLRTGNTPFGSWAAQRDSNKFGRAAKPELFFVCQCCQQKVVFSNFSPCYCHPLGIHCLFTKIQRKDYGEFRFNNAVKFLIFDEIHRCGVINSLNAEILIAAKRQNIKMLGLSATAACNPLNMRALGYNLDLHGDKVDRFAPNAGRVIRPVGKSYEQYANNPLLPNFYRWAARYGCRRDPAFHGFKWMVGADKQQAVMADIRSNIIPARGVRVRVEDIPGFPKRDIAAELYDIEDTNKINQYYREMASALELLHGRASLDSSPDSAITKLLRTRQRIELLKVPVAAELASDYIDKGYSIGIFVNFRQTLDELRKRFPEAALIYGGQSEFERQRLVTHFQNNTLRLILIMSDAGGVGLSLPDISGANPRGGLVMPTDKAVTMRQIFGRFHRDDSKSNCFYRVLLAAGTIEEKMNRALNQKFSNLDILNDGDLNPL